MFDLESQGLVFFWTGAGIWSGLPLLFVHCSYCGDGSNLRKVSTLIDGVNVLMAVKPWRWVHKAANHAKAALRWQQETHAGAQLASCFLSLYSIWDSVVQQNFSRGDTTDVYSS